MTMLYRSTDRLCRCGAPVQYLSHTGSFYSLEKYAPPNAGTKHLIQEQRRHTRDDHWELDSETRLCSLCGVEHGPGYQFCCASAFQTQPAAPGTPDSQIPSIRATMHGIRITIAIRGFNV
jgi:hypothetical protein